jgi:peptidoglycan/xylan/chitin deacetylase (PgdA/CDA1 family)
MGDNPAMPLPLSTPPTPGRRWRASGFLRASAALHAAALAGVAIGPQYWAWALGAVAANHAALAASALLPRCTLLGANWTRLPEAAAARGAVAITLDDGPDPEVTPRVLELFGRRGVQATFFCIGERAARYPQLVREIVAAGHGVENHSLRHRHDFALLGLRQYCREIGAAQDLLRELTGSAPRFFRAPAGLRNPFLDPALARLALQLVSWTRRGFDTRNGDAADVLARLTHALAPGDILLLHDGHAARTPAGVPVVLEVLPRLLDALAESRLRPIALRAALD